MFMYVHVSTVLYYVHAVLTFIYIYICYALCTAAAAQMKRCQVDYFL